MSSHVPNPPRWRIEFGVIPGLEAVLCAELSRSLGPENLIVDRIPGRILVRTNRPLRDFLQLRTAIAAYLAIPFDVPRPRALLGQAYRSRLEQGFEALQSIDGNSFESFRISASGSDSRIFQRLSDLVQEITGLPHDPYGGELLIRVRPGRPTGGWDVLMRLTPRPLSARAWRVRDFPGAINSTIAAAMVDLTAPQRSDRFLNPMSGSATLLIERAAAGPLAYSIGCEISSSTAALGRENVRAAGFEDDTHLVVADTASLPFEDESFDKLCADLPWGARIGSHEENKSLYPAFLSEAMRVSGGGARLAVLTHDFRLFESALKGTRWEIDLSIRLRLKGAHPRLYVLSCT